MHSSLLLGEEPAPRRFPSAPHRSRPACVVPGAQTRCQDGALDSNHSEAPSPFERRLLASRGIFALQNGTSAIQQCPASGICPCSLSTTLALVTLRRGRTCTFSSHTETIFHVPGSLTYLDLRRNNRHTVVAGGVRGSDIFIGRRPASHRRPPRRPLWVF